MRQISLLQGKALLVELPEGAKMQGLQTTSPNAIVYADTHGHSVILDLPPGNWRIIGMLSEVTEEQAKGIVDDVSFKYPYLFKRKFEDYSCESENDHDTALESLESAILAEGYGFDSEPEPSYSDCEQYENPLRTYEGRLREWNSRQSRVLDRSRCLLLGREG